MIDAKKDWIKLTGIGMVVREVAKLNKETTIEKAFHIGSVDNIEDFSSAVRNHWGIESMHWSLDYPRSSVIREEVVQRHLCLCCA